MSAPIISFQVVVRLEGGIGVSLINKVPEELVFASLTGINIHYTQLAASHMLELSIQDVQVPGWSAQIKCNYFQLCVCLYVNMDT